MHSYDFQQQQEGKTASLRQKLQILGFQADEELLELLATLPQFEDQLCLEDYILPEAFALMQSNSISLNCLNDLHYHHGRELLSLPSVQIQQRCLSTQAEINAFESENSILFPEISKLSQIEQEYSVEFQDLLHEFKEKSTNLVNALTVLQNSVTSFREFQGQNVGFSHESVHDFLSSAGEECDSLAERERKFLEQTMQEINDSIHLFESEISLLAEAKYGNQCSSLGRQAEHESEEGGEILKNAFFELNNCISTWNLWMKNVNLMFLVACQAAFSQQQQWKQEKTNLQNLALDFSQMISQQLSELINCFATKKNDNHAASSSAARMQEISPNFNSFFVEPATKFMHLIQESIPRVTNALPKTSCIVNLDSQLQPEICAIFHEANSLNERIQAIEMESTE